MRTKPRLSAVAVGYPLAQQPDAGHGDTQQLFALAVELLERNRTVLGSSPQSLSLSSQKFSLAVHAFSETRFVAAAVQGRAGAALLRPVEKAGRSESDSAPASRPRSEHCRTHHRHISGEAGPAAQAAR